MVLRLSAHPLADRMSVIETNQPLAMRPMQRQRVVDAVRLRRRHGHLCDDEPDPVAALGVDDEYLSVKIKKRMEGRIWWLRHPSELSY